MAAVWFAALSIAAGGLDLNATVAAEARAGSMPFESGDAPRPFVASLVMPGAELALRRPDLDLRLGYGLRVFWQDPTSGGGAPSRPLLLHTALFRAAGRPSSLTAVTVTASGSMGEADYSLLPQVFGAAQGALPVAVKILTGQVAADLRVRPAARWRLAFAATVEHRRPLGDGATAADPTRTGAPAAPPFPSQTLAGLVPSAEYQLSRRDDLSLIAPLFHGAYSGGVEVVTAALLAGWRTRLSRRLDLYLAAGVAGGRDLGAVAAIDSPLSPVGSARFNAVELRPAGVPVNVVAAADVVYLVDPILKIAAPHGVLSLVVLAAPGSGWTVSMEATVATSLRAAPATVDSAAGMPSRPDETALSIALPVRHRFSDSLLVEAGGRATDRAPSLVAPGLTWRALHQRQLWVYLTLLGTSARSGAPAPR